MALRRQICELYQLSWRALQRAATAPYTTSSSSRLGQQFPGRWASQQRAGSQLGRFEHDLTLLRGFAAQAAGSTSKGSGKKSPITFNSMLVGVGAFLAVVAVAQNKAQQKVEGMMQRSQEVVGKAAVGGPFTLTDQDGKTFTQENLLGKFNILYFGFTHCPDICPDELEKLAVALDLIEKQQNYQVGQGRPAEWELGRCRQHGSSRVGPVGLKKHDLGFTQ
jgi:hypothetical protein